MTGMTFNFFIIRSGQGRNNPRNDFVDTEFVAEGLRWLSALKVETKTETADATLSRP